MLLVGLTGGIGSGKSTVATGLASRGAVVVDADTIAREVVLPGQPAYEAIVTRFGPAVLLPEGPIDRPALARIVFADSSARADLNAITHPRIGAEIAARVAAHQDGGDVVVLDIPLLDAARVDIYQLAALVVVDLPEDLAVARLVAHRGFTEADAKARVASQISRQQRCGLVELVRLGLIIDNSGDRHLLENRINEVWEQLESAPQT